MRSLFRFGVFAVSKLLPPGTVEPLQTVAVAESCASVAGSA